MIAFAIGSTILFCFWARIRANGDLAAKLPTRDEARQIAAHTKLPDLLRKP
jgi:hypothetical protein